MCLWQSGVAQASEPTMPVQYILQQHRCKACHAPNKKVIGPSFQAISAKYPNDINTVKYLSARVKNGGSGVWGVVAMPAIRSIGDADLLEVITWIMTQQPAKQ